MKTARVFCRSTAPTIRKAAKANRFTTSWAITRTCSSCAALPSTRNKEVYAVNNDVADNMVVYGYEQDGDSAPARELKVDHGAWGVAMDQDNEEVAITTEHINKISIYRRTE